MLALRPPSCWLIDLMGHPDGCISAPRGPVQLIYVTRGGTYTLFFLVSLVIAPGGREGVWF